MKRAELKQQLDFLAKQDNEDLQDLIESAYFALLECESNEAALNASLNEAKAQIDALSEIQAGRFVR